jgi:iron complex outermembrane receptor protein
VKCKTLSVVAIFICLLALSYQARAEVVHGVISDPSGAVIAGAVVQLWAGDHLIATAGTDAKGNYSVHLDHDRLPAANLRLSVSAEGFAAADRALDFASAAHLVVSVRLEIAAIVERINVDARSQPMRDQLDMSEVRESPAKDVGEALTAVDGVYKIRKAGIANDVVVRGFQQNNVNVLIDGARIYGACPGHMDPAAQHVDFAEVERVDVIKGAFDVSREGSLGATVEVVTKTPPLGWRLTPSMTFGSFGYYNPSLTTSFGNNAFRALAGYSYRVSDPYKDGSGRSFLDYANFNSAARSEHAFSINTGWLATEFKPTENQKLSLGYTRQQSGLILYPYSSMDSDYDNADRASVKYEITNLTGVVRAIRAQSYITQVVHFMSDSYRKSAMMGSWMMSANARSRAIGGHIEADAGRDLTFGFESYHRNWNMMGYMRMGMMLSANPSVPNVDTNALGVFADFHHAITERLKLTGGVRFDHATMSTGVPGLNTDAYFNYQNTRSTSATDNYGSGNARLSLSLPHSVELFAGVGTTGRIPDAEERYIRRTSMTAVNVGDPNLPIVRNTETTLGAIFRRGSSYIKPTLFYSSVNDYILVNNQPRLTMAMGPATARSYTNVDARIYGGELSYAFRLPAGFSLTGGGSYAKGVNDRKPQAGVLDSNLPEMPALRAWSALRYTRRFAFAEVSGTGVARQNLVDRDLKETQTAGYGLMDVKLGMSYRKLSFSFAVDNLLNHYYYEHLSYYRDPFASGIKVPEPGRNFFGQMKVNF